MLMHTEHSRLIQTLALLDESGDGQAGSAQSLYMYRYATAHLNSKHAHAYTH
jgi:hypothetical protein